MKNLLQISTLIFLLGLNSCSTYELVGHWQDVHTSHERITFTENGVMKLSDMNGSIRFQYQILKKDANKIYFNIDIYRDTTLVESAKHLATFHTKDTVTMENIDFPEVRSDTYFKIKPPNNK